MQTDFRSDRASSTSTPLVQRGGHPRPATHYSFAEPRLRRRIDQQDCHMRAPATSPAFAARSAANAILLTKAPMLAASSISCGGMLDSASRDGEIQLRAPEASPAFASTQASGYNASY